MSTLGQLGVVSGTALDLVLSRRLQDGDPYGRQARLYRGELRAYGLLEVQHLGGMRREYLAVGGEAHSPNIRLQQRDPRLLLELGELLRDGRRAVRERLGDSGQRPAKPQLMQQAQPP